MEENGANKTTTFTPADLHDDQIGDDTINKIEELLPWNVGTTPVPDSDVTAPVAPVRT